jgi:hypothetical protein
MPKADPEQNGTSLPLRADPASGALIGTFLVALCLGGPVGLVLVGIVWLVYEGIRRGLLARVRKRIGSDDDS